MKYLMLAITTIAALCANAQAQSTTKVVAVNLLSGCFDTGTGAESCSTVPSIYYSQVTNLGPGAVTKIHVDSFVARVFMAPALDADGNSITPPFFWRIFGFPSLSPVDPYWELLNSTPSIGIGSTNSGYFEEISVVDTGEGRFIAGVTLAGDGINRHDNFLSMAFGGAIQGFMPSDGYSMSVRTTVTIDLANVSSVPEPASWVLFIMSGALMMWNLGRRRTDS